MGENSCEVKWNLVKWFKSRCRLKTLDYEAVYCEGAT